MEGRSYSMPVMAVTVLILAVLFGTFLLLLRTPYFNPLAIIPPILLTMWFIFTNTEWGFFAHNKKFNFKTGVYATMDGQVDYNCPGGKFRVVLWVKKRIVDKLPGSENLVFAGGVVENVKSFFTRDLRVTFYGDRDLLQVGGVSELDEGSVFYDGSLSGCDVPSEYAVLRSRLRRLRVGFGMDSNLMVALRSHVDSLSKSQNKDLISAGQNIHLLVNQATEYSKDRQQVVAPLVPRRVDEIDNF